MHAVYKMLSRIATVPILIIACILFVSFTSFVLPRQKAAVEMYTREAGSPGLNFFPKPEAVYKMAEAYGVDGARHIKILLVYDFAWPLVYSFFYLVFIHLALGYAHNRKVARLSSGSPAAGTA